MTTIWGPCPGCDAWQLEAASTEDLEAIEEAMREHALECSGLFLLVADKYGVPA